MINCIHRPLLFQQLDEFWDIVRARTRAKAELSRPMTGKGEGASAAPSKDSLPTAALLCQSIAGSFGAPDSGAKTSQSAIDEKRDNALATLKRLPDLTFTALLFAIVESACEYLSPQEVIDSGVCAKRNRITTMLEMYHSCCKTLLTLADFNNKPTLCALQAIIIMRHYCFNR